MRDKRKISILFGLAIFIIALPIIFVVSRKVPVLKELTGGKAAEIISVEAPEPDNSEAVDFLLAAETADSVEVVQDTGAAVPAVRTGLESTNPATVKLASGDIQLIELFAFW